MITLQEQFEKDFPDKSVDGINANEKYKNSNFTNWDLDLREYKELKKLSLGENKLTSIDFLNTLPHPEKLEILEIYDNNIQPTTLDFLKPFTNLKVCKLGENVSNGIWKERIKNQTYNKFYGSLEPIKHLHKLEDFCIACTDVEEGIEYMPILIVSKNKEKMEEAKKKLTLEKYENEREEHKKKIAYLESIPITSEESFKLRLEEMGIHGSITSHKEALQISYKEWLEKNIFEKIVLGNLIDCQPLREDAKVARIQNELRPFNYDLEAWQLAHPEKMSVVRPELFIQPDSRDKWLQALTNKITNTRKELQTVKENQADKLAKIARLETKISELELTKSTISQQTQTDFQTQNKETQTDLSAEQITKLEQKKQTLKKLLKSTEQELENTKNKLQESQQLTQEQIKQLESKIKLLEQQKSSYQTKYDKSIEFIKEIREDIAKS